jgi:hypothetical protein
MIPHLPAVLVLLCKDYKRIVIALVADVNYKEHPLVEKLRVLQPKALKY